MLNQVQHDSFFPGLPRQFCKPPRNDGIDRFWVRPGMTASRELGYGLRAPFVMTMYGFMMTGFLFEIA